MKVISTNPDGSALVEFENLVRHTEVVGVVAPIQALVDISSIPGLIRTGQKAKRGAQKINSIFAKWKKYEVS